MADGCRKSKKTPAQMSEQRNRTARNKLMRAVRIRRRKESRPQGNPVTPSGERIKPWKLSRYVKRHSK